MALTGSGTTVDPYLFGSVSEWNQINNYTGNFKATSGFDVAGGKLEYVGNGASIDLAGYEILNIGGFLDNGSDKEVFFRNGGISNGRLDFNVTVSLGSKFVFHGQGAVCDSLRLTGSITNTGTGDVAPLKSPASDTVFTNSISEMNLTGNGKVIGFSGGTYSSGSRIENVIVTGTLQDAGAGTAVFYGFGDSGSNKDIVKSCFWDTDKSTTNDNGGAIGKTTAELQTLSTYTDVGLTLPYNMEDIGSWTTETWKISEGSYPILGWDDYGTLIPSVTFTDEVGSPIVGAHVLWIEETAFAAANPSWNSPVIVSSTGVTDANGVVTYSGTVDPAKVYTAVLRDYEYVNGAWQKAQGSDSGQQNVDLTPPA